MRDRTGAEAVRQPRRAHHGHGAMRIDWDEQPLTVLQPCPVCGAPDAKRVRCAVDAARPGLPRLQLLDCAACGSAFYDNLAPPAAGSRELGAGLDKLAIEQGDGIELMAERLAPFVRARVARCLGIGCGFGFLLDFARFAYGWTVKGLDPSPLAAAGRDRLGLNIAAASCARPADLGDQFDLVLCTAVVERLAAPGDFIRQLTQTLSRHGTLVLTTPDAEAVAADAPEDVLHSVLNPGAHLVLYSAGSLETALRGGGFTHVRVRKRACSLIATASLWPLGVREAASPNRALYRRYLGARAAELPADSPAANGMLYRLFEALVDAHSFRKAGLAFENLRDSYSRVYGIDLDKPSSLAFDAIAGLPFAEFARRHPFNLSGVLFLQGRCELDERRDPRRAIEYFRASIRAADAVRDALHGVGTDDARIADLTGRARLQLIIGLAEVDAAAALAEFQRAVAAPAAAGDGDRTRPLSPALSQIARRELFVRLVDGGSFAAAESLRLELAGAPAARRPAGAVFRLALAKLVLVSRIGRKLLRLSEEGRRRASDLARLHPDNRDYRDELRSLMHRCLDLAGDPRRLAGVAEYLATHPFTVAFAHLSFWWSLARRRTDFIKERWAGRRDLSSATKVAVFSHFDAKGVVHDFVANYLREITEAGFTVIFVSNASALAGETVDRLLPWCGLILRRANVGYDFGAYKDGIGQIPDLRRVETLLLANDSVYGPFHPLNEIVARMDRRAEVWGITDSWERRYHLQSYFLLFGAAAVQSACFRRFWTRWRYVNSKYWNISRGEIGLSRELGAHGLRCQALFPYRTAAAALHQALREDGSPRTGQFDGIQRLFLRDLAGRIYRDRVVNGTHYFWDYLVARQGCPFLKRELLRDNPVRVPFVREWEQVVRSASAYDTGLIARHLALSAPHRGAVPDPAPPGQSYRQWFI